MILVTGCAGYLGGSFSTKLLEKGYKVIGIDNFINSSSDGVDALKENYSKSFTFEEIDLTEKEDVKRIFSRYSISAVVHFAALKSVDESQEYPIKYWDNNVLSTINLAKNIEDHNINKTIFSSSASVYGDSLVQPIKEIAPLEAISTYADTKIASEYILKSICNNNISCISLRYFNPVGTHKQRYFLDKFDGPNIIPKLLKSIYSGSKFQVYGSDYQTKDGTCERDYIHVDDLIDGHLNALECTKLKGFNIFNLGTGIPSSVLELINNLNQFLDDEKKIKYELCSRRIGDVSKCFADISKAKSILNFSPKHDLEQICRSIVDDIKKGS